MAGFGEEGGEFGSEEGEVSVSSSSHSLAFWAPTRKIYSIAGACGWRSSLCPPEDVISGAMNLVVTIARCGLYTVDLVARSLESERPQTVGVNVGKAKRDLTDSSALVAVGSPSLLLVVDLEQLVDNRREGEKARERK
ncbi:unnamed protein product [Ilex paraguariensis]|uniref:Uncharacterized protein n=1 Tax=Ilex paraguariensis TaxID=185542 RepID=A0ABC8SPH2_9AQUA